MIKRFSFNTIIVGSGAAGLNAADLLWKAGQKDIAVVTNGVNKGTSRNTGSDKQTYYKLSTAGAAPDSVMKMAETLFSGGSVDGDTALCEAAGSLAAFYRLVWLGVPFPYNDYGEYPGYRTDHDENFRATSCGPLTSKYMTEALEREVRWDGIEILDDILISKIFAEKGEVKGVGGVSRKYINKDNPTGAVVISAKSIIWATGGPAAIYSASVYPESAGCAHGAAFEAGAVGQNLTESQYGIASLSPRWNLSGSYQQVLPRYYSTDGENEFDFLSDCFKSKSDATLAVFRKGYEWPFDAAKTGLSSKIDLAVFREREKGRRVFIDYRQNPSWLEKIDENLPKEAYDYLCNCGAVQETPAERLLKMNSPAVEFFRSHGVDLFEDPVEIDVCAQHNNGGFAVDTNWESTSLRGFFPVGECAGTFGVKRPGGSALNSGQVGSRRAAEYIAAERRGNALPIPQSDEAGFIGFLESVSKGGMTYEETAAQRKSYTDVMTKCGAFLRSEKKIKDAVGFIGDELKKAYSTTPENLPELLLNRDILITQYVYLSAILDYIAFGGKSRGAYMITDKSIDELIASPTTETDKTLFGKVMNTSFMNGEVRSALRDVRPVPASDTWFEKVYSEFAGKDRFIR